MQIYNLKNKLEYLDEVAKLEYDEWADNKEENRKCRIGYVAYGAYWQRTDNCFYNILQRHMTANHFGDNFGGQIGKNIGLYATAQTIGKYYHCLIGIAHDFYRITAGYLSVFDQLGFANFTN